MASPYRQRILSFITPFMMVALLIIAIMSYIIFRVGVYSGIISSAFVLPVVITLIALPLLLLVTVLLVNIYHNRFLSFLYTIAVIWFPGIIYFFLAAVAVSVVALVNVYLPNPVSLLITAQIFNSLVILSLMYGIINANVIRITKYQISSSVLGSQWEGKKIILFSDVHIGAVRGISFMKKIVRKINELNGDLVLLAGDVIDGPKFDYAKDLAPLKDIKAKLIYTPGNHEGYNWETEKFYPVIASLTHMLADEKIMINDTQVIGLRFRHESKEETRTRLYKTGFDKTKPSIVLLHDPTNAKVLEDEGVTLGVSGHTHKGQFFPFNLFMTRIYKEFAYGKNIKGNTTVITTSGIGTMMPPLRLGSIPEIVVITVTQ